MTALKGIDLVYQLVQDDIRRPDLMERVWRRIHREALNWHRADDWKRDLVEGVYQFEDTNTAVPNQAQTVTGSNQLFMNWAGQVQSTLNVQVIDLTKWYNFRKIGYLRKYMTTTPYGTAIFDPTTGQQGTVQGGDLVERGPDSMFDGYGYDKRDCFYRSGDTLNINSSTPLDRCYFGYFRDPTLNLGAQDLATFELYDSWIIDHYPNLIACAVKAKMFNDTGKVEEANGIMKGELREEELRLRAAETRVSLR